MKYKTIVKQLLLPGIIASVITFIFVGIVGGALHKPTPKDLPLAIVAPAPITQMITSSIQQKAPDVFAVTAYENANNAKNDLKSQKTYGVVEVAPNAPIKVTVSSAIGEAPKQIITQAFTSIAAATHQKIEVIDTTPSAAAPGRTLTTLFLLLVTTVVALASQLLIRGNGKQSFGVWIGATVIAAALTGLVGAATAAMIGEFGESFWGVALALAASGLTSALIVGAANALFGVKGVGLAGLLLVPLGLATASLMVNYHMLPDFYSMIAPYMPSFATIDAIRQTAYLDNVTISTPYMTLAWWSLGSLLVIVTANMIRRNMHHGDESQSIES